jgi:UDP-glucose 4-epimerase
MRIAIVGATGNVGTALLRRLADESDIELVGIARRSPLPNAGPPYEGVQWHNVDIGEAASVESLAEWFAGADAVVHLAWQIQPSRNRSQLRRTNLSGTRHVVRALQRAGVPKLVYASSFGAYAPGPKDGRVDENWPVTGIGSSNYSIDKAAVEALLDGVEREDPALKVIRIRTALVFQREAGAGVTRNFLGRLTPTTLLRWGRLPVVPRNKRLRAQVVHADDAAQAYLLALRGDRVGAFNVATDPVLDGPRLAKALHGRAVPMPLTLLRVLTRAAWQIRLLPAEPGWLDLTVGSPLMDCTRAEQELGWRPRRDSQEVIREAVAGIASGAGSTSEPLRPSPRSAGQFHERSATVGSRPDGPRSDGREPA